MWKSSARTFCLLFVIVASSVAASIAMLALVRALAPQAVLVANNDVAGSYLQTLGTVYAVLLAFVVFVVWTQHNEARSAVEKEANEIADLYRTVHGFSGPCRGLIRSRIEDYVRIVADQEWTSMASGQADEAARRSLDLLWKALESANPATPREENLYCEALARFNDLSDGRTHRLLSARLRLPPTMWLLLVVGAALTVGSMGFFGVASFALHALMTAALAGLVAFVLFVICDLDNPFWGDWKITPEPLLQAVATEAALAEKGADAETAPR